MGSRRGCGIQADSVGDNGGDGGNGFNRSIGKTETNEVWFDWSACIALRVGIRSASLTHGSAWHRTVCPEAEPRERRGDELRIHARRRVDSHAEQKTVQPAAWTAALDARQKDELRIHARGRVDSRAEQNTVQPAAWTAALPARQRYELRIHAR